MSFKKAPVALKNHVVRNRAKYTAVTVVAVMLVVTKQVGFSGSTLPTG